MKTFEEIIRSEELNFLRNRKINSVMKKTVILSGAKRREGSWFEILRPRCFAVAKQSTGAQNDVRGIFQQTVKVLIVSAIVSMIFADIHLLKAETAVTDYTGERIQFIMRPCGKAEYNDLGVVDLNGIKVNLVTFSTKAFMYEESQKIYSDPESSLPYKIEHTISKGWVKEFVTQEYDQKNFTVVIRKFEGVKLVNEQIIKANGPIQDAILLPFYLSRLANLKVGWHSTVRIPAEFTLELVSIDNITVPAGAFRAYHLKSIPNKFEIWINENTPRVPLRIEGKDVFNYGLVMKEYSHRISTIEAKS